MCSCFFYTLVCTELQHFINKLFTFERKTANDIDMKDVDGWTFWNNVDSELTRRNWNLGKLCAATGIPYNTISVQRVRHSLPKIEQVYKMASSLNVSMEFLLTGNESSNSLSPRLRNIINACMKADELDLLLVERILRNYSET